MKFLYKKKQILNERVGVYLECANQWQGLWHDIQTSVDDKLKNINDAFYEKLN
jgi:hypothetical protein